MAIDKKKKESNLSIAKRVARRWLNNPVLDTFGDGKETKEVKNIVVTLPEQAAFLIFKDEDRTAVENHAKFKNQVIVEVMKNGKEVKDKEESEQDSEDNFDANSSNKHENFATKNNPKKKL